METLGCPKNQVDSDKLEGVLAADGLVAAPTPEEADVVVVNTCAFIEAARAESIETILALAGARRPGAHLVVTGCLATRSGAELVSALPEVDRVVPFGGPLLDPSWFAGPPSGRAEASASSPVVLRERPALDLLELPRPPASAPWAYVKVAEGCDRACGFCAIPSFRGPQRSRRLEVILEEVNRLAEPDEGAGSQGVSEVVLVAQDIASWGRDRRAARGAGAPDLVALYEAVSERVPWVRLLYLYPSALTDRLLDAVAASPIPYFDLSLQHASRPLLRAMRRFGDAEKFLERIAAIRERAPGAALRSSFIVGYPGETEADHDGLLEFLQAAELDWAGFFAWSREPGTHAAGLPGAPPPELVAERLAECAALQESVTEDRRRALVGSTIEVLVDEPGIARSFREAPEIDGVVEVPAHLAVGTRHHVRVVGSAGPDLEAVPVGAVG
jgi:ribosomal protein S12 methylthiotransferase